jgi:hypothetical protein
MIWIPVASAMGQTTFTAEIQKRQARLAQIKVRMEAIALELEKANRIIAEEMAAKKLDQEAWAYSRKTLGDYKGGRPAVGAEVLREDYIQNHAITPPGFAQPINSVRDLDLFIKFIEPKAQEARQAQARRIEEIEQIGNMERRLEGEIKLLRTGRKKAAISGHWGLKIGSRTSVFFINHSPTNDAFIGTLVESYLKCLANGHIAFEVKAGEGDALVFSGTEYGTNQQCRPLNQPVTIQVNANTLDYRVGKDRYTFFRIREQRGTFEPVTKDDFDAFDGF